MRRLVAALVVLALPVALTACGGGGEEEAATVPAPEAAAPAPARADMGIPVDISPTETVTYEPLVKSESTAAAPASVLDRIEAGQPMVLFFYDKKQPVTVDQNAVLSSLLKEYRGLVDLVSFDIGKYVKRKSDGSFEIDTKLAADENSTRALSLAESLGVDFTPYVLVTDANGYIVYRGRGLVDQKTLERQVLRVGE